MKIRISIVGALILSLLLTSVALATGPDPLAIIRGATAKYHRLEVAEAEEFIEPFGCIAHESAGAMGYHYLDLSRFDDQLYLEEPEVLLFERLEDGQMKLTGVEFIIPAAAWEGAEPPEFLGQTLKYKETVGPFSVDPYYELHVWVWKYNPSGVFADWNPTVSCSL